MYALNQGQMVVKYEGEEQAALRDLFRMAESSQPSVVFLDEIKYSQALCQCLD